MVIFTFQLTCEKYKFANNKNLNRNNDVNFLSLSKREIEFNQRTEL